MKKMSVMSWCLVLCVISSLNAAEVASFLLIDAGRDVVIGSLSDGAVVDLSTTDRGINIGVKTVGTVQSVRFGLDDNPNYHTESVAPFAMFGDNQGNYGEWVPAPGKYTLTAVAFSEKGAKGTASRPLSITLTVKGKPKHAIAGPQPQPSQYKDIVSDDQMGPIPAPSPTKARISGQLKQWHCVILSFTGPQTSETASPNPFLHYRLNVEFRQGSHTVLVPGYYAGDGKGAPSGNLWQVRFAPPQPGTWHYRASFRAGFNVNVSLDPQAGRPTACHGTQGSFDVAPSDKKAPDFRAPNRGLLINRGHHYLTFPSASHPWIKGGPNIPENFLGYDGFENTPNVNHRYTAHAADWHPGDPDWGAGQGKRIIGALNYIAQQGGNCLYFLPMNIGGDGKDTFPTIAPYEKTRYDNSKLLQWEIVFQHAQSRGILLHFQLAETEDANENYHDNGELGPERKLFYRQLVALFGHHNAIEFNIGEENDYDTAHRVAFARYIKAVDPCDHPVSIHTHGGKEEKTYDPIIDLIRQGNEVGVDMTSYQGGKSGFDMANLMTRYCQLSDQVGHPWVMSYDEPQPIHNDMTDQKRGYPNARRTKMWPAYMGGGGGFEWYIQKDGGGHSLDQRIDDFSVMKAALNWCAYARQFLYALPLTEVTPSHSLASAAQGKTYVLAKPGAIYGIYNDQCGRDFQLDLTRASGTFTVLWFNPRSGGSFQQSNIKQVTGGAKRALGQAPDTLDQDWACLVKKIKP